MPEQPWLTDGKYTRRFVGMRGCWGYTATPDPRGFFSIEYETPSMAGRQHNRGITGLADWAEFVCRAHVNYRVHLVPGKCVIGRVAQR